MLMVSDMISVARGGQSESDMRRRAPLRFDRAPNPAPVVVWNVSRDCNMTCPHCYAAARPGLTLGELTTEEGMALLEDLAATGVRVLIFSGGEPLLRKDLLSLARRASELGMIPNLSSNGTLIDESTAEALAEAGVKYVGISIDGDRAFNDDYRGLADGFDLALRGLRLAKAAGMNTGLRTTITRRTLSAMSTPLETMLELARKVEADRFYLAHLVYAGRAHQMVRDDLSVEESRALMLRYFELGKALLEEGHPLKLVTGSNDSGGPLLLNWLIQHYGSDAALPVRKLLERRRGNTAGEAMINIDSKGRVHPDQFWSQATLGDVRQQPLAEILDHPLVHQLQQREKFLHGRCAGCRYLAMCRGSHRERALSVHGDLWAPDPACVMEDQEILMREVV